MCIYYMHVVSAMDASDDCFCVTDPHGNRACTPPGCGANIPKVISAATLSMIMLLSSFIQVEKLL